METKKFWKSKTIIVGVLSIIAAVATYASGEVAGGNILTIEGIMMIVLRCITKEKIS